MVNAIVIFAFVILFAFLIFMAVYSSDNQPDAVSPTSTTIPPTATVEVKPWPTVAHTESPDEVSYAGMMRSVGDEVSARLNELIHSFEVWDEQVFFDVTAMGEMLKEAGGIPCPAGYSQLQVYFQLAGNELDMAAWDLVNTDAGEAAIHLRSAVNYISLGYMVQGME